MLALLAATLLFPRPGTASETEVIAIDAGGAHTCAVTDAGGVKCWGWNSSGQVGDGTTGGFSPTPVDVVGLGTGAVAVATGRFHTCALTAAGSVKCWGLNGAGQLGDGTTTDSPVPVDVVGLGSTVVALAAGGFYNCALTEVGGIRCWGSNSSGQLGDGQSCGLSCPTPLNAMELDSGVTAIATGGAHTCALTADGAVTCAGLNAFGQLGGTSTETCDVPSFGVLPCSTTPVDVPGLPPLVDAIAAGSLHTCALTGSGEAWCWGRNGAGQVGNGATADSLVPVPVSALAEGVTAIAPGGEHTCALTAGGAVKCWGQNASGQVGDGTSDNLRTGPVDVVGLGGGVTTIAAGGRNQFAEFLGGHTCALTTGGGVKCWGDNELGQLGTETAEACVDAMNPNSSRSCSTTPVNVTGFSTGEPTAAAPEPTSAAPELPATGSAANDRAPSATSWLIAFLAGTGSAVIITAVVMLRRCPSE